MHAGKFHSYSIFYQSCGGFTIGTRSLRVLSIYYHKCWESFERRPEASLYS
jgi:hypothetical protein